ncbi:uncharacterized protein [Amphiura filiformis]|uniref:uncharacterized protein n=1 Tax=Amphiura filiformis TaxID=82378 RepID=UPI003B22615C
MHTASRMMFLGFLIYATVQGIVSSEDQFGNSVVREEASDEALRDGYLHYRGAKLDQFGRVVIFIFIAGMTLREINDIRRMGRKMYLKIGCSKTDILQLVFYWIYIALSIVAIIKAHQTVQEKEFLDKYRPLQSVVQPQSVVQFSEFDSSSSEYHSSSSEYHSDPQASPQASNQFHSSNIAPGMDWRSSLEAYPGGGTTDSYLETNDSSPLNVTTAPPTIVCYTLYPVPPVNNDTDETAVPISNMTIINVTINSTTFSNRTVFRNITDDTADGVQTCVELQLVTGETISAPMEQEYTRVMVESITVMFAGESRYSWSPYDELLLAEAAFALANILTFGRLLQTVVMISGRLGVLAISLFGMVGDIVKFLILFTMTLLSFALGMTQLYRPFDALKLEFCEDDQDCPNTAFIRYLNNM